MGWDEVSLRVIKKVAREIAGPLSRLFNCCMRGGHYPTFFKVARVVLVFKSKDPTEFSNYRPISVLPVLLQVFERVLQGRLLEFLDHQGVVIPVQYGFRSGHSTAIAVLDMVEGEGGVEEEQGGYSKPQARSNCHITSFWRKQISQNFIVGTNGTTDGQTNIVSYRGATSRLKSRSWGLHRP
jgi:hypothetical protein